MKKITVTIWCFVFIIILSGGTSWLFGNKGKESQWQWQVDDLLTADRVNEYHLSPDGNKLVWTITRWDLKEQKRYNTLYLTLLEKKKKEKLEKIRLTHGQDTFNSIQWVPGENKISFKTSRKFKDTKPGNLWVMNLNGGDPYPVTSFKNGIQQYKWLDKDNLLFVGREEKSLYEKEIKEKKDTSEVVEDEEHRVITRLFKYNLQTKKNERLTGNIKPIGFFTVSYNKKWVIYSVDMSTRYIVDQEIKPKFYLMNLETGESKEIFADPKWKPGNFRWAMDSTGFYVGMRYSTHPKYTMVSVTKIYWYPLETGKYKEVDLQWDKYGRSPTPTANGFIIALLNGVHYKYARFFKRGDTWKRQWIKGETQKNIQSIHLAKDGKTMIYTYSTASLPQRYYLAELKGSQFIKTAEVMEINSSFFQKEAALSTYNSTGSSKSHKEEKIGEKNVASGSINTKPLARTEIITWEGALDDTIEGILYYPYQYRVGKKYPLIVMIHGGPHGADMDFFTHGWSRPVHLLAERGTFILRVNYHGSSNYGLKFGESISGHYYEYEIQDIENGVDYLISQGKVDKDRLGIMGWSNGAILGTALTVHTDRYKAASLGAGDVNWTSDYGNCIFGVAFDNYYFGGPPWEKPEQYIKLSPLFQLQKVTTPTLIFHGTKDRAVPYEQGWEYYRALQQIGKAPVRFISFPGEGHGPRKLAHQRRKLIEDLKWFEKYLFKTYEPKNHSLKKGSPLEQVSMIAKVNNRYGVEKKGMLVPEIVEYKKIKMGRFEVTRAQWAAFDKKYQFDGVTGNYPVTGITFEQAREYVRWLSQTTGESYRLPKKDDIKTLYSKRSGNTFDYWAGYTLNPEDYKNLQEELKNYKNKPVLLKPVGSFKAMGDNPVFDLGGNAAEWVEIEAGKGKACGCSAERPNDAKSEIQPLSQYTGLRVVKE